MPLSSQLQQQWQTVCERLPESLPASSLSEQAQQVLTFSDFVQESICANPDWLAELDAAPPLADAWQLYARWLNDALVDVADETLPQFPEARVPLGVGHDGHVARRGEHGQGRPRPAVAAQDCPAGFR